MAKAVVPKEHLGDGAYAEYDGYGIVITAENGIVATDTVYLEPSVLKNLDRYRSQIKEQTGQDI
jgi:hypothetical protein